MIDCWGDDLPAGKVTDFRKAVQVTEDETVIFSWIEWPDKETRESAYAEMTDWMNNPEKADPRMNPEKSPMPFDGKRVIYGHGTLYRKHSGEGRFNIVNVAIWKSAELLDKARQGLSDQYAGWCGDPGAVYRQLGVVADIAAYTEIENY